MKLQSIIPIIFLIISPFAANAEFTTYSGYCPNGYYSGTLTRY